jgi:hypothetical protein
VARLAEGSREKELWALAVAAPAAEALTAPLETALSGALSRRGFAAAPLRGTQLADPEAIARAIGADRLLRVRVSMALFRRELSLSAEAIPTRPSFFLQRQPAVRPGGARLVTIEVPTDTATLQLLRSSAPGAPPPLAVALRLLFRVEERVLALAAGDAAGDGSVAIAAVTPSALSLHGPQGQLLARRLLEPPREAVRHPAATAAIGDFGAFGGGRIACRLAGAPAGEVLAFADGELRRVAPLAAAPLWAGPSGARFGAFLPGKASLADLFGTAVDLAARPRSQRELAAFAGAPRPGRVAFGALWSDGVLTLLSPDLEPWASPVEGVGAGLALADLDGDGEPELVVSAAEAGPVDRVRVLRLPREPAGAGPTVLFESPALEGSILAGAAADLTGDGLDDAVLAAALPSGESQVWLVTGDPRLGERR